jgi:hypothetical protein
MEFDAIFESFWRSIHSGSNYLVNGTAEKKSFLECRDCRKCQADRISHPRKRPGESALSMGAPWTKFKLRVYLSASLRLGLSGVVQLAYEPRSALFAEPQAFDFRCHFLSAAVAEHERRHIKATNRSEPIWMSRRIISHIQQLSRQHSNDKPPPIHVCMHVSK